MVLYQQAQQVGRATIAVGAREEENTEDISKCCRGGDSERRDRFGGLSTKWFPSSARERFLQVASKNHVKKLARVEKRF